MFSTPVNQPADVPAPRIGCREPVGEQVLSPAFRQLLVHREHMTIVLERHNEMPIDVDVLGEARAGSRYIREVLLRRSLDQNVVQYAILSVDLQLLPAAIADDLLAGGTPFGRILKRHAAFTGIERLELFSATIGETLAPLVRLNAGVLTYGRSIGIGVEGERIGEALEVLMPGQATIR